LSCIVCGFSGGFHRAAQGGKVLIWLIGIAAFLGTQPAGKPQTMQTKYGNSNLKRY